MRSNGHARSPVASLRLIAVALRRWLPCLLWVPIRLGAGALLQRPLADATGLELPGFPTAMLVGVALTNSADLLRQPIDTEFTDLIGTLALRIFLAIALLSLDWSSLVVQLPMILSATAAQIVGGSRYRREAPTDAARAPARSG